MWWLNKRIRAERELCCDEIALAVSGNRLEYAQALTLMAEWEAAPRLAMAANRGPLTERIFHILGRKSASAGQRVLGITGSVLFLVAALAAANALFVVAAPPIAQARESVKAVLSASQITVAHLAQQVFQASEPAKPSSPQTPSDSTVPEAASNDVQQRQLAPPAVNLSGLPAIENLPTPTVLASSAAPNAKPGDQPAAPAQAVAPAGSAAPKTQAAIMCLLGMGKDGCETAFVGGFFNGWYGGDRISPVTPDYARRIITDCWFNRCQDSATGPLKKVDYLGANKAGADVYVVTFMHREWTFVIAQPTPEGRILAGSRFFSPPSGVVKGRSLVELQPPVLPARTIYSAEQSTTSPSVASAVTAGARPNLTSNEQPVVIASSSAGAANASGPKTEAGIRCLFGLGPDGCGRQFDTMYVRGGITYCADRNWDEVDPNGTPRCSSGALESIEYLGTNATGDEVYSVRFMHGNKTYVLRPPGPDGKIARVWTGNDLTSFPSRMTVASPASPVQILYTRPAEWSGSSAANASGPKTEAGIRCLLGLGPDGCWRSFGTTSARFEIIYCTDQNWSTLRCPSGALENIEYLGTNATGEEVYSARFMHRNTTYVLRAPRPGTERSQDFVYLPARTRTAHASVTVIPLLRQ